ncbi:hypothetical protein [Streptomyces chartreusis]
MLSRSGRTTAYSLRQRAIGGLLAVFPRLLVSVGSTLWTAVSSRTPHG